MTTATAAKPRAQRAGREAHRLTDEELTSLMGLWGRRQHGAQAHGSAGVPSRRRSRACRSTPSRPSRARSTSSTRPTSRSTGRASSCVPGGSRAVGATPSSSCARSCPPTCSPELRADPSFNVEVDVAAGRLRLLGVVQGPDRRPPRSGMPCRGGSPLRKLFSKPQRAFFREHAPEGIDLDALVPLGPTFLPQGPVRRQDAGGWRACRSSDRRRAVALPGRLADPRAVDEVRAAETFQVAARDEGLPRELGASSSTGVQQTKTRTALEFYAKALANAAGAGDLTPDATPARAQARRRGLRCGGSSSRPWSTRPAWSRSSSSWLHRRPAAVPVRIRQAPIVQLAASGLVGVPGRGRGPRPRRALRPAGDHRVHRAACSCPRWACSWSS